jgi:hypothetical protein
MENPLGNLKDSSKIEELMKSAEGRKLAERMLSLSDELENLPDSVKIKFSREFGDKFSKTLNDWSSENNAVGHESLNFEVYAAIICVFAVFSLFRKFSVTFFKLVRTKKKEIFKLTSIC